MTRTMNEPTEPRSEPHFPNAAYDLVVIGASAGGLKALLQLLAALPVDFPAAIAIVQHMAPHFRSQMAEILSRRIHLPAVQVSEGDFLAPAHVYIAPPDYHLSVKQGGVFVLSHEDTMNYVRPSANYLFSSAAEVFKDRLIGVILTGTGSDGAMGVAAINAHGGKVIVQDQASSDFFSMPSAAIQTGGVDFVLPLSEIAKQLCTLVMTERSV
jgi:two-component system, chemotaxis family, protein-glutamate methylesterase/glutaminase